ncbi:predicted protein [Arabidopsis lyrata subsp. lyrata]|uniref:Predicted protein n=1 Tax=Arabidopsis lyrata subsp. lyrata TaxID=81972 RepID=D7LT30_ARALL|nr:UPF0481 protein At3g47200 [Arabidopsis lyrata subsp. lyrata]EFH53989.1 predicted protein [Arabidopsis lyrata subsp. lyrata]|eukprot:XP_002877730.1 UPF0481 protein At3g47200 [Arabidopsis lyrata subsp. lyrata]
MVRILSFTPPPPPPPPPSFRSIPRPPPPPSFRSIPPRRHFFKKKSKSLPPPPPPLPPARPFGPILPWRYSVKRKRNNRLQPSTIQKDMLTWYLLTLMMRQKLHNRNKQPEETRGEWVISIRDKMEQALREDATTSWDKLCIYRVPQYLQENNKKSYFPQTVSLGPFHHGNKHLLPMDRHKWRAVNMVMARTKHDIEMYIDAMKELEDRARACYEGPIDLSSNKFCEMLVLDGCFVLELFRGADEGFSELGYDRNDPVFAMRGSMHSIQRDMVMLENQLPLFVLNRLLEIQLGQRHQTGLVAQLAVRFFDPLMPTDELLTKTDNSLENDKFFNPIADKDKGELHCLDVFRRNLLRPCSKPEPRLSRRRWSWKTRVADKRQQQLIHCVTELREAGIKFRRRKTDRFWDIRFENGYLEIPKLLIHDGTKSLFSNLIAFEQCHIDSSNDITSYIIFMDNLIDSPEDVSYLHYCGIIEHWLGNDYEVADLFNRLCQEVAFDPQNSYLSQLSNKVDRNYSRKWNVLKAILKHKYFNNPWAYFSFFAALVLLFLTLFQSFFTAYPYFYPPS